MKRILALALALCMAAVPAGADTWNVDTAARLSEALSGAKNGDTINIAAGTYSITSALYIEASITIRGAGRDTTILDGGGSSRIFFVEAPSGSTVAIDGLTFHNGSASLGGALYVSSGAVTVEDCDFKNNAASNDGGRRSSWPARGSGLRAGGARHGAA